MEIVSPDQEFTYDGKGFAITIRENGSSLRKSMIYHLSSGMSHATLNTVEPQHPENRNTAPFSRDVLRRSGLRTSLSASIAPCKIFHKFSHFVSQIAPLNRL